MSVTLGCSHLGTFGRGGRHIGFSGEVTRADDVVCEAARLDSYYTATIESRLRSRALFRPPAKPIEPSGKGLCHHVFLPASNKS